MILEAKGLGGHFTAVAPNGAPLIAGPDADTPAKPDPTMLRRLMAGAGAGPADTIAIGDMEVDSEFARAAGCRVVLIPGGSRTREELQAVDADALLDSIAALPAWLA
jgi:phosphoglycolate phosphatase